MKGKAVTKIASEHIEAGIKKYDGMVDTHLENLLKAAKLSYTPYMFKDGRVLLVLPNNLGAFLYESKEILLNTLSLE